MKKERQKLEDNINLILQDYSNDTQVINSVTSSLMEKGIPRGRVGGIFTQAIPLSYINQAELCLFTKYLYQYTHEFKINPETFFNELELSQAENYRQTETEKTNRIVLHNVDQINEYQWLCTKETYQNIAKYFENGLLTYNPKTQRQPLKRKVGDRIIEVINVDPKKISEITEEMLANTFFSNAITWNIRKITGMEKFKYNKNDRTLTIEVGDETYVDVADGFHRSGAMLKTVEQKPDIDRVTSIYIYNIDEERARAYIRQEAKSTPISEEWQDVISTKNVNMEVAKNINSKQRMNEMFSKVALDNTEIKRENKLVTFETLAKAIEYNFDLNDKPFIIAQNVERQLIETFNIVIGINHSAFNENLSTTRENSYMADNNSFIGYIALAESLKQKYPDTWQDEFQRILKNIDFSKAETNATDWKKVGLENNLNLSTVKRISEYFKSLS
jgi:hypothetical protein